MWRKRIYFNVRNFHGINFMRLRGCDLKFAKSKASKYFFSYSQNRSANFMQWKFIAQYIFKCIRIQV